MSVCPFGVGLKSELQFIVEIRHVSRAEQTESRRVVQELDTDTAITFTAEGCFIVETFDTLEPVNLVRFRFLVVEIVFTEEFRHSLAVVVVEKVYRETVNAHAHIVVTFIGSLRGCEPATAAENIVNYTNAAGVVRTRRIRKIRLQTED